MSITRRAEWFPQKHSDLFKNTDIFNAYLALSNFSIFTTNRWCTPNTLFFMSIIGTDTPITHTPITRFLPFNFEKCQLPVFFLSNFEKNNHEKTCIWCTPSICCGIRKIGQRQIGVKNISEQHCRRISI